MKTILVYGTLIMQINKEDVLFPINSMGFETLEHNKTQKNCKNSFILNGSFLLMQSQRDRIQDRI